VHFLGSSEYRRECEISSGSFFLEHSTSGRVVSLFWAKGGRVVETRDFLFVYIRYIAVFGIIFLWAVIPAGISQFTSDRLTWSWLE